MAADTEGRDYVQRQRALIVALVQHTNWKEIVRAMKDVLTPSQLIEAGAYLAKAGVANMKVAPSEGEE